MNSDSKPVSENLAVNMDHIKQVFFNCNDMVIEPYHFGDHWNNSAFIVYFETITQNLDSNYMKSILQDLILHGDGTAKMVTQAQVIAFFENKGASFKPFQLIDNMNIAVNAVLSGQLVVFFDNWNKALSYNALSIERRQITEPPIEATINGPREGTIEDLTKNIGLLRGRLPTPDFKTEFYRAGGKTQTMFMIGYLDSAVNKEVLAELKSRISRIGEEEVLETSYIREAIEDSVYSPFPQYRVTERPDVAVSAMLEGKIIIMAHGTGSIMICPTLFVELFQSAEDYYQRTIISSLIRQLRILAYIIALLLPSIYIALTTFHPELIPSNLLLAMLNTREGIPFPAFVEAVIMQFFFELLREAGIRLPRPIGSAVSIVGALIIGEASITAGIASPVMVVVVALTGIASFSLPQYELATSTRIISFPIMVLSFYLGGFGVMFGCLMILLHLTSLRSLGQPYFSPLAPQIFPQLLDVIVRAPLKVRRRFSKRQQGALNKLKPF